MSESVEMYLVMIALLRQDDQQPVPLSLLANRLSISPVSANEMCRKLEERGLVSYQPYKGVTLTGQGEEQAQLVLNRRRMWVVFLVENLGIEPDEADEIACQLEHITSEKLVNGLKSFLENAPSAARKSAVVPLLPGNGSGQIEKQLLISCSAGQRGHIADITADAVVTDFLHAQGISFGVLVEVLAVGDNGSLLLGLEDHHVSLARCIAAHIEVVPLAEDASQFQCTWKKCSVFWACPQRSEVLAHDTLSVSN